MTTIHTNSNKDQGAEHGQRHWTENARKGAQGPSDAVFRNAKLYVSIALRGRGPVRLQSHPVP